MKTGFDAPFTLCQDNDIPIVVFNMNEEGTIKRALLGEDVEQDAVGKPFTPRRAQELAVELRGALRRQGRPDAQVAAEVSPPDEQFGVRISLSGNPGNQVLF